MPSPPKDLSVAFRYRLIGGHVHIRMFAGLLNRGQTDWTDCTRGNCGTLIMSEEEFSIFRSVRPGPPAARSSNMQIEFIPEDEGAVRIMREVQTSQ